MKEIEDAKKKSLMSIPLDCPACGTNSSHQKWLCPDCKEKALKACAEYMAKEIPIPKGAINVDLFVPKDKLEEAEAKGRADALKECKEFLELKSPIPAIKFTEWLDNKLKAQDGKHE